MSHENVEIVRGIFAMFGSGDVVEFMAGQSPEERRAQIEALYTPDVEIEWIASIPDAEVYRGHEGAARAFTDWLEAWDDFRVEPQEFVDAGDHVLVPNVQRAQGKASGVEVELKSTFVCTIRDGKVARIREFDTKSDAMEAVRSEK